jgi:hypothetical protein
MRRGTIIALALVALLQAGYILLVDRGSRTTDEERYVATRVVADFARERVERIAIDRSGAPPVELRRAGRAWRLTRPFEDRADNAAVEEILSSVEFLESIRVAPATTSRAQLGLDPPAARLLLEGAGPRVQLELGAVDPSGQGVYLAAGLRRMVVERALLSAVSKDAAALRDRDIVGLQESKLRRVRVTAAAERFVLQRGDRGWTVALADGPQERAVRQRVELLLSALRGLRATRFPAPAGAVPHGLRRLVMEEEARTLVLLVGRGCPGRVAEGLVIVAERGGLWACVANDELAPLLVSGEGLRDHTLTDATEPELTAISIRTPRAGLDLRREAGSWRLGGAPADDERVRAWVDQLRAIRGELESVDPGEQEGLQLGTTGGIRLGRESGGADVIALGVEGERGIPARRGEESTILWVLPAARRLLVVDPQRFRSRRVLDFSRFDVSRLTVARGGSAEDLTRRDGVWQAQRPQGATVDAACVDRVLRRLSGLEARRFTAAVSSRLEGAMVIGVRLEPEAVSADAKRWTRDLQLRVGADVADGCVARTVGVPPFVLKADDCRLLRASCLRLPARQPSDAGP